VEQPRRTRQTPYPHPEHQTPLKTETVPDMIWAKDLDNNYLFANKAVCGNLLMCGSGNEPLGRNDLFFARRERERGHAHTFGEICINSDEVVKRQGKTRRFLEDGLVRGTYMMLDVHKAPMFSTDGKLIGTVGTGRDVTQEMRNLEEKQKTEQRYRLLAENVRDVIWTMNADLAFTYFSPSIADTLGYSPEEFLASPLTSHYPKNSISFFRKFEKHYKGVAKQDHTTDRPQFWEFEMLHKDGSSIWLETITSPMRDKYGVFLGVVGISRDVTQRVETQTELEKAREEALAASKAKSEFLANMSHEIRTPMNGILGMLQLLKTTELDSRQAGFINTAIQSGTSLLNLITDILDFS
jgi:PAS domain S-box-containing protein